LDLSKTLGPYAQQVGRTYNILPGFIMAVAILETGDGTSRLCTEANNLFSIKGNYNGSSIHFPTIEYINGKKTTVTAEFRKYPSYKESCIDFCELMKNGVSWNRAAYSRATIGKTNLDKVLVEFGKTPYMTDPNYSGKLLAIVKEKNLYAWDTMPTQPAAHTLEKHYTSLVDFLKSKGKDSSFHSRTILANRYGVKNYSGTAAQNNQLLTILEGKL
jgi:flagellum-specific peptidoglycan hydrolase FlgJ